jgi:hypothetical protein
MATAVNNDIVVEAVGLTKVFSDFWLRQAGAPLSLSATPERYPRQVLTASARSERQRALSS